MDGHPRISAVKHKQLFTAFRATSNPDQKLRLHLLLLWGQGYSWSVITAVLFCSPATVARWVVRYRLGGLPAVTPLRIPATPHWWVSIIFTWVIQFTPTHFGYLRSRWSCTVVADLLRREHQVLVGRETVRRHLHQQELVWRRPRPVLRPKDRSYHQKISRIRHLLATLPDEEIALFQDEAEIATNPKIGSMWMLKGRQATVETPGTNQKQHLVGSLAWGSEQLVTTWAPRRNTGAFLEHLDQLRRTFRRYRLIHVICDNANFHKSKAVKAYLKKHPRLRLHYLPKYAPETNPIERVWWHLHNDITRNHRCPTLETLLNQVDCWLRQHAYFAIDTRLYFTKSQRKLLLSLGRGVI
jgi:putative transposase